MLSRTVISSLAATSTRLRIRPVMQPPVAQAPIMLGKIKTVGMMMAGRPEPSLLFAIDVFLSGLTEAQEENA